jgi:hypothetical protein
MHVLYRFLIGISPSCDSLDLTVLLGDVSNMFEPLNVGFKTTAGLDISCSVRNAPSFQR